MQDSSPAGYWEGLLGRLTSTMSLTVRMPCRGRYSRAGDCWMCRVGRGRWRGLLRPWMGCGEERDPGPVSTHPQSKTRGPVSAHPQSKTRGPVLLRSSAELFVVHACDMGPAGGNVSAYLPRHANLFR